MNLLIEHLDSNPHYLCELVFNRLMSKDDAVNLYKKFNLQEDKYSKLELVDPDLAILAKKIDKEVKSSDIKLFSVNDDPKTFKSFKADKGILTAILYLAPHKLAGVGNKCPCASNGCITACLNTSGNPAWLSSKMKSRINKTRWFSNQSDAKVYNPPGKKYRSKIEDSPTRVGFLNRLQSEISKLKDIAARNGLKLSVRLNGTTDINWKHFLGDFIKINTPEVEFYDYTKVISYIENQKDAARIHYTFSRSEDNHDKCIRSLKNGTNVAVVFDTKIKGLGNLPEYYMGHRVISGDKTDLRFLDDGEKTPEEIENNSALIVGLNVKSGIGKRQSKLRAKYWELVKANGIGYISTDEFKNMILDDEYFKKNTDTEKTTLENKIMKLGQYEKIEYDIMTNTTPQSNLGNGNVVHTLHPEGGFIVRTYQADPSVFNKHSDNMNEISLYNIARNIVKNNYVKK